MCVCVRQLPKRLIRHTPCDGILCSIEEEKQHIYALPKLFVWCVVRHLFHQLKYHSICMWWSWINHTRCINTLINVFASTNFYSRKQYFFEIYGNETHQKRARTHIHFKMCVHFFDISTSFFSLLLHGIWHMAQRLQNISWYKGLKFMTNYSVRTSKFFDIVTG